MSSRSPEIVRQVLREPRERIQGGVSQSTIREVHRGCYVPAANPIILPYGAQMREHVSDQLWSWELG